ncbi:LysR family transcriptional regulator [Fructilactobacillus frigidiflavus]|uniref:LysR family transcriptional regulator n=1 Tax=Fructilactobacillus frigidiflavus TaxID=3242688 RepID=UPI003756F5B4
MNKYLALKLVLEHQSITKAANIMGYSQPAISQMLNSLEQEFGFPVLSKQRQHLKLTKEGQAIYPFVVKLINDHQALLDKQHEITDQANRLIRIATIPSISQQWLPELISAFQFQNPNVDFSIIQGDNVSIPQLVENGDAELGILNQDAAPDCECEFLQEQTLKAVIPQKYPIAAQVSDLKLAELTSYPYILLEEGLHSESLNQFRAAGLKPHIKMRLHDRFSTLLMVEQGLGYTIMPVDQSLEDQHQIRILKTNPKITRKIGIITKNEIIMTSAAEKFKAFIQKHAHELT